MTSDNVKVSKAICMEAKGVIRTNAIFNLDQILAFKGVILVAFITFFFISKVSKS